MKRLVFFGSSDFGLPSLDGIIADGRWTVSGIVSQPPRPVGRGRVMTDTPVAAYAKSHQLPLFTPTSLRDPEAVAWISGHHPDAILVAAYGLIIPSTILDLVPDRALNIHASLLPKYRGAAPVQAAIFHGETKTGVSFMVMTPRLDDGPIIAAYELPIQADERAPALLKRCADLAAHNITAILTGVEDGTVTPTPQQDALATYAPKLTREDGRCQWLDADQEVRRLRAYDPWPGCWTIVGHERIRILDGSALKQTMTVPPGTIVDIDGQLGVSCTTGVFLPTTIRRQTGRTAAAHHLLHEMHRQDLGFSA